MAAFVVFVIGAGLTFISIFCEIDFKDQAFSISLKERYRGD